MRVNKFLAVIALSSALLAAACGDSSGPTAGVGGSSSSGSGPLVTPPSSTGYVVPVPTITGPIGAAGLKGHPLWDSFVKLSEIGYAEEEYFVSGSAKSYSTPSTSAPYTTRIIVRRPVDATKFNGTVLLDWVNVTAQFENAVDTLEAHQLFHREGFAYVHVSAQAAGVCCTPLTPMAWDPVRYATLSHPGDAYAFDMYSQIAKAFKTPPKVDPMAGLRVQRVIAMGQSQSGTRMRDYVATVQADAGVIDAFLVHADGGANKLYPAEPLVPVIQLMSEREANTQEPNVTQNYRLWEVAGAAHQDFWIGQHQVIGQGPRTTTNAPQQASSADDDLHDGAGNYGEQYDPQQNVCIVAGTQFPLRYSVMAAIHYLDRWVKTGVPPPTAPRFEYDSRGALARDADGNALGGLRLPPIDVPVASYRSDLCNLGGITIPFTGLQLATRYASHADYFCQMQTATRAAQAKGYLLNEDALDLMQRVEASKNRFLVAGERKCD